jgi:hypothetical protein
MVIWSALPPLQTRGFFVMARDVMHAGSRRPGTKESLSRGEPSSKHDSSRPASPSSSICSLTNFTPLKCTYLRPADYSVSSAYKPRRQAEEQQYAVFALINRWEFFKSVSITCSLCISYVCGSISSPFTYNKLRSLKLQPDNTCRSSFIMRQTLN